MSSGLTQFANWIVNNDWHTEKEEVLAHISVIQISIGYTESSKILAVALRGQIVIRQTADGF